MKPLFQHRRALGLVALAFAAAFLLSFLSRDFVFRMLIRPSGDAISLAEVAQEGELGTAWIKRPANPPPGGWETPWGVDVFFVHSTTAIWPKHSWNAELPAQTNNQAVERAVGLYANALEGAGPLYAPAYRQAVLQAMLESDADSRAALNFAYADVLAAFDSYLKNDNRQRAIILVGVEQGALHVARLLADRFGDETLRRRLGAVYLIDLAIAETDVPVPVCSASDETGCFVAWTQSTVSGRSTISRHPSFRDGSYSVLGGATPVCVNPLSWSRGGALAPITDHAGGVAQFDSDGVLIVEPAKVSTRCVGGILEIAGIRSSTLRPARWWGWGERLVPADYNLFYADIAANVAERARMISARLDTEGPKPARPLPPMRPVDEAPIHRPEGGASPLQR